MSIQVQEPAPKFKATAVVGAKFKGISLADFKGKWLVLFFYPLDFTFVCPTEITAFNDKLAAFKKLNASVVGCSVDSQFSHLAWKAVPRKKGGLGDIDFPLIADMDKSIAREYEGLLDEGISLRGVFIIDPKGIIRYKLVHDLGIGRNPDEILRVLAAIQQVDKSGEVCPVNWTPGSKTMKPDPVGSQKYFSTLK